MGRYDLDTYHLVYLTHTDKAVCVAETQGDDEGTWLPLSQVDVHGRLENLDRGDDITVDIPEWLADKECL